MASTVHLCFEENLSQIVLRELAVSGLALSTQDQYTYLPSFTLWTPLRKKEFPTVLAQPSKGLICALRSSVQTSLPLEAHRLPSLLFSLIGS